MARGGSRQGTPGKQYQNRSDLQGVKVATGLPYGENQKLRQAQQAVPLPKVAQGAAQPTVQQPTQPQAPPTMLPGAVDFGRTTERPQEPVTTGLPIGAGQGPEALQTTTQQPPDVIGAQLRALYQMYPNNDLLAKIEMHDRGIL